MRSTIVFIAALGAASSAWAQDAGQASAAADRAEAAALRAEAAAAQADRSRANVEAARLDTMEALELDPCTPLTSEFFDRFQQGSDQARAETLDQVRVYALTAPDGAQDNSRLACSIYTVRTLYARRAGRQQTILATESWITGVAGVVAAFSDGAGTVTQGYWGAASLIPVLISRFNANEPIRDLYHGATQGADWLAARYIGLNADTQQLNSLVGWTAGSASGGDGFQRGVLGTSDTPLRANCTALNNLLAQRPPERSAQSAEGRDQWLRDQGWAAGAEGEAQRVVARTLVQRCAEAAVGQGQLETFMRSADYWRGQHYRLMAHDILAFDALLTQREHDVTYSPFETFSALAASPFEAAAALISGEDGREALDRLKVEAAFSGLNMVLQPIEYPALPRDLVAVESPTGAPPAVMNAWSAYETFRMRYAAAQVLMRRLQSRAQADRLSFSYDANANIVSVVLARPVPPSATPPAALPPTP